MAKKHDDAEGRSRFELLWGLRRASARGPKPTLNLRDVVAAGVALADAEGLAAVTMARTAAEVDVTPMALYHYVPDKETFLDLMADSIMRRPPRIEGKSWRRNLTLWAAADRAVLIRHPWALDLLRSRAAIGPNWARWLDLGLKSMEALPFSLGEKFALLLLVDGHARTSAQIVAGAKSTAEWSKNFALMLEVVGGDTRYPTLSSSLASGAFDGPALSLEAMYSFGLTRVLDGIEALAARRGGK